MNEGPNLLERETFVCGSCTVDKALQVLVLKNVESNKCNYCDEEVDEPIAAPFNLVMAKIFETISTKYADAQETNLPWVEGEWLNEEISIFDVVGDFDPGWNNEFLNHIIDSLDGSTHWAEHVDGDWVSLDPSDTLSYGWANFKEQVLTKTRYLVQSEPDDKYEIGRPDYIPISSMLDALGDTFSKYGLIHHQPKHSHFFRVRAASSEQTFSDFCELGVPPIGIASGGRMNPPGISYFYIALDEVTAVKEVISQNTKYFVGNFSNKDNLNLIDFVNLPEPPSSFEPERYNERHCIYFLYQLKRDLVKPVSKDGMEHIDYIPTQVISEYFRYRYKDVDGKGIDGFIYPSVKNEGGINIVLFDSDNESLQKKFDLIRIKEVAQVKTGVLKYWYNLIKKSFGSQVKGKN